MKQDKIKTLTWAGLMCAIVVVTTMFAAIPIPGVQGAYANAGDAAVYASAHLLGWPWGVAAAAIGSMLADLLLGSALYAPATFVIKGVMALLAVKLAGKVKAMIPRFLICGGAMVLGYFLYECLIYGASTALISIPANLMQAVAGALLGAIITKGIITLLIRVLNGRTPQEILDTELYFIDAIGLAANLSPTRANGLAAMVKQMRLYALAFQAKSNS